MYFVVWSCFKIGVGNFLSSIKQLTDICVKRFKPFPNKPWFLRVCSTSLLKTLWEKEKLLITSDFSFFPSVFYPFGDFSAVFTKLEILVCKLFQFGRVQNVSVVYICGFWDKLFTPFYPILPPSDHFFQTRTTFSV